MTDTPALVVTPPAFLMDREVARVLDALPCARVVGGAVRDTLAGLPVADIDVASPLQPEEVLRRLEKAGVRCVPTGLSHGTVTAVTTRGPIEITTLRHDVETDGRHAVVAFTADWQADAARRDFTINAMSMRSDGAVFDYFGGIADLRAHRVRFVGDPAARITEDYLRVLRFFRFYARYGGEAPDQPTADALRAGVAGFDRLSAERVWSELKRILTAPDPSAAIRLMAKLGVLQADRSRRRRSGCSGTAGAGRRARRSAAARSSTGNGEYGGLRRPAPAIGSGTRGAAGVARRPDPRSAGRRCGSPAAVGG